MKKRRNWELFWQIIQTSWTVEERVDLRAAVEAWMAAEVKQ